MGDDYIRLGIPVNIGGVDQYPHAIYNKTLNPKTILQTPDKLFSKLAL